MRSFRTRRRRPLAAASTAVEHVVLRHFGLQLTRHEAKASRHRAPGRAGRPTLP
jgi:hypothetical protein